MFNPCTLRIKDVAMDQTFTAYLRKQARYYQGVVMIKLSICCFISFIAFLIVVDWDSDDIY